MALGTLLLRLTVGGLFVGHGLQKLTGAFDGPGLDGVEGMMQNLEIHPPRQNAVAVAATETFGGAALALGAATPVAAAGLIATMVTAVRKVHLSNGVWNSNGGWEFNAALAAAAVAVASDGPGVVSIDAIFGKSKWGFGAGVFALVAGVAGSFAVTEYAKRAKPAEDAAAS
ncbi:putative oxidoreductase [Amnibacterium kyonggiense]|uniref:Putative oxidoreductase n=2 Tax=Amnibacterium kyonggiense TaxID=595671 RepID=A0A4R7FMJ0_9MICO|nr:putative oxidoreductase [Amnibacterium kyonggiense]